MILAPEAGWLYTYGTNSYGPSTYADRHECLANSTGQSASDRMTNGNIFVAVSNQYMYEVDANGNMVWQYNASPAKAFRYECDHAGIAVVLGPNPCGLSVDDISGLENITTYPNPSNDGLFYIEGLPSNSGVKLSVSNTFGQVILEGEEMIEIDLSSQSTGIYLAIIILNDGSLNTVKLHVLK